MLRTRALVHATICTLALWGSGVALGAQAVVPAGDASARPDFPPRRAYNHAHDVQDRYEPINDVTRVFLDLSSNNVLPLLYGPVVHLTIESRYQGAAPATPPESVLVTVRVYRMSVALGREVSVVARTLALSTALGNRTSADTWPAVTSGGVGGSLLSFVPDDGSKGNRVSPPAWRASLSAASAGSRLMLVMDSAGVQFASGRWLAIVANIVDTWKHPDEVTASLSSPTGRGGFFSLDVMPGDLRQALGRGMTVHVTEEAHQAWLPLEALLQMASAPAAVKARLLQVDFQLDRSKLEAVRDFTSRLAPR